MPSPVSESRLRPLAELAPSLVNRAETLLASGNVPGATISVVLDDVGYQHAYGVKSVSNHDALTTSTSINIGSCSKAFGSALIASLVDDDLVAWDDPISRYVPEFQLYDEWVTHNATLRDLCGNRLGLPRTGFCEAGFRPDISAEYVFEHLKHTRPIAPFRDRFTYVNAGHAAVGVAAARILGKPFIDALRERILEPLGMHQTSGGLRARDELEKLASWHALDGDEPFEMDAIFTDQYLPSGGMCVSSNDAVQWLRFHLNKGLVDGTQVVSSASLSETHQPVSIGTPGKDLISIIFPGARFAAYCLGWATADFEGHLLVQHSGSDFGVSSMTLLFPQDRLGIAVYSNINSPATLWTAYALAEEVLELPERDWKSYLESFQPERNETETRTDQAQYANQNEPERYTGTFVHPADGPLVVEQASGKLICHFPLGHEFFRFELKPSGEDKFSLHPTTKVGRALLAKPTAEIKFRFDGDERKSAVFCIAGTEQVFEDQQCQ